MAAKARTSKPARPTTATKTKGATKRTQPAKPKSRKGKPPTKAKPPAKAAPSRKRATATKPTTSTAPAFIERVKEVLIVAEHPPSDALRDRLNLRARELVDWDEIRNAESLDFLLGEDSVFSMPKLRDEFDLAVYLAAMVKISAAEPALRFTIGLGDRLALCAGRFEENDRAIKEQIASVRASRPSYEGAFRSATITLVGLGARLEDLDEAIRSGRRSRRWRGSVPRWSIARARRKAVVVVELDGQLDNVLAMLHVVTSALEAVTAEPLFESGVAGSIVLDGEQRIERSFETLFDWHALVSDLSVGRSNKAARGEWLEDAQARTPVTPQAPVSLRELAPMLAGRTLWLGRGPDVAVRVAPDGTIESLPLSDDDDDDDDLTNGRYRPEAQAVSADGRIAFFRVSPDRAYLRDLTTGVEKAVNAKAASELVEWAFVDDELIAVHCSLATFEHRTLVAISMSRPYRRLGLKDVDDIRLISDRGVAVYLASRDGKPVCGEIGLRDFTTVEHPIIAPETSVDWRERRFVVLPSGRVLFTARTYRKKTAVVTTELFALEDGRPRHLRTLPPLDHVSHLSESGALVTYTAEPGREDLARIEWDSGALTSLLVGLTEVPDCGRIAVFDVPGGAIRVERSVRRLDEEGGGVSIYSTVLIDEIGSRIELAEQMRFADATSGEPRHESAADGATLALATLWTSDEGPRIRLALAEAGRTPVSVEVAWPLPVDETDLELRFAAGIA